MLEQRILDTLRFFALLNTAVTTFELHKFLIIDLSDISPQLNRQGELISTTQSLVTSLHDVVIALDNLVAENKVTQEQGYYTLPDHAELIQKRLRGYFFGIQRERMLWQYAGGLRHVPFVRGVAVAGSQALGLEQEGSDIDLLIVVDPKFLWLSRTLVTIYFQIFGARRHGKKVANRFCLNHYIADHKKITTGRNLYTAFEYGKLRPIVYPTGIATFQQSNSAWMKSFFPNLEIQKPPADSVSIIQKVGEWLLRHTIGSSLDKLLGTWQAKRIHTDEFVVVAADELSFHPDSKQQQLLSRFFKFEQKNDGEPVELVPEVEI